MFSISYNPKAFPQEVCINAWETFYDFIKEVSSPEGKLKRLSNNATVRSIILDDEIIIDEDALRRAHIETMLDLRRLYYTNPWAFERYEDDPMEGLYDGKWKNIRPFRQEDECGQSLYHISRFEHLLDGLSVSDSILFELNDFDFEVLHELAEESADGRIKLSLDRNNDIIELSAACYHSKGKDDRCVHICGLNACEEGIYYDIVMDWLLDAFCCELMCYGYGVKLSRYGECATENLGEIVYSE